MSTNLKQSVISFYLDYLNGQLTTNQYAESHGLSYDEAKILLKAGTDLITVEGVPEKN